MREIGAVFWQTGRFIAILAVCRLFGGLSPVSCFWSGVETETGRPKWPVLKPTNETETGFWTSLNTVAILNFQKSNKHKVTNGRRTVPGRVHPAFLFKSTCSILKIDFGKTLGYCSWWQKLGIHNTL